MASTEGPEDCIFFHGSYSPNKRWFGGSSYCMTSKCSNDKLLDLKSRWPPLVFMLHLSARCVSFWPPCVRSCAKAVRIENDATILSRNAFESEKRIVKLLRGGWTNSVASGWSVDCDCDCCDTLNRRRGEKGMSQDLWFHFMLMITNHG